MEKSTVINTYNESSLHRTLKTIYAAEFDGKTEQKSGAFICDIITTNGEVIEIQTSNVSALTKKAEYLTKKGLKIRIVHPVIQTKIIETYSPQGNLLSKRTSPKSETIYSKLRGLTGIYHLLTNPLFTLEIINITITETRIKTEEKVQTQNKARHHLKNWLTTDKKLISINNKKIFKTNADYKKLLPEELSPSFTPPQLYKQLLELNWPQGFSKTNKKAAAKNYNLLLWLLCKMNIIEKTEEKSGKSWIYKIL